MSGSLFIVISLLGSVAGGALGAYLSKAAVWKGAVSAALATIVQSLIVTLADIEHILVSSLIYLVAVGLIGGRWGLKLTGRQLSHVVIGSFLFPLLFGLAYLSLALPPASP